MPDVLGGVGRLTKIINNLELQFKSQDEEIKLLRRDNAELRKEIAALTERMATVEESRNTIVAQVETALTKAVTEFQLNFLREQNQELRNRLPPSDTSGKK